MSSNQFVSTVGTFGLTVAGGFLFGPIGFAAGALLGGFLFGSSGPTIEGPRLGDLSVSASTYGGVIPVCFGVQKVAGTMIWATAIDEDKNTDKVGEGIFGGGQKIVEYRYFANFAVAFGEGPAGGVLRIWAGEKLIADLRSGSGSSSGGSSFVDVVSDLISHIKYNFRIYLGTDDQEPDPLIRERVTLEHGEHAVPAHRGPVYIVFDDFPLDEFGNRIAPITAEISWAGAPEAVVTDTTFLNATNYNTSTLALDPVRGELYYLLGSVDGSPYLGRVRTTGMGEEVRFTEADMGVDLHRVQAVDPDGNIYATIGVSKQSFRKIDGDTLQVVATRSFSDNVQLDIASAYTLAGRIDFVLALGFLSAPARVFYAETLLQFWEGQNVSTRPRGVVAGLSDFGACEGWFAGAPSIALGGATTTVNVLHVRMELPFEVSVVDSTPAVVRPKLITLAAADYGATNMTIGNLCYDEENDRVVFFGNLDGVSHLWSLNKEGDVVWRVPATGSLPLQARFRNGQITVVRGTIIDLRSGEDGSLLSSQDGFTGSSGIIRYNPLTGALYTATSTSSIEQWIPGRSSDDAAGLDDVVTALCGRVGLEPADLDVSELANDEVRGFGIARQISLRGALELLALTYSFDAVESDHQLKFKKRGQAVSRVLGEDDLVMLNERETYGEARTQEVDLPVRFSVRYQDADRDAEVATQTVTRIRAPDPTVRSDNNATLDLPITLTGSEAMAIAMRQLYSAWLERVHHEWRLAWTHVDLEPADVVQIALDDGTLFTARLVQAELGANLELAWKTVVEESSSYEVQPVPAGGLNYVPNLDPLSSEARLVLLDAPLIHDLDDVGRAASGHYWVAGAFFNPPWRGAVLFSSDDGAVFAVVDETLDAIAWGTARSALPDTDLPFQTDTTSELVVNMVSGSLSSVTELEMLGGANLAALVRADGGVECIQFQDAAVEQGSYRLTTLLRGRRGTEVFTGDHAIGDLFVLLTGEGVQRRPLPLSRIGDTLSYRVVGRGGELRDARTEQLTLAGNDLKPYAPAHLAASGTWGFNLTLSWMRRTRVGGELLDGFGEVPLAEDTEAYELEILFGSSVVRTETDLTSPSYVYSAADQAVDFPGYVPVALENPRFETGDLTGWTVESGGTFIVTGGHGDTWFLRSSGDGTLAQPMDVSALAQQIDLGLASARARCWIAETTSDSDTVRVRLQFLDENDVELDAVDPVATDPTGTTFVQIEAEGTIPVGTRQIKVRLDVDRVSGASPNVALDDVTLEIDPGAINFLTFAVYQISAQVGRGFRAAATLEVYT